MSRVIDADYLVVGAGAAGMAFVDALIDHADVRVVMVDRRHGPGGHWNDAYPFVRLHQASVFYGVASTLLGGGRLQQHGPEAGVHERASQPEILDYYGRVLDRMVRSGKVEFLSNTDYDGAHVTSLITGERREVGREARIVDGRYLSPAIPAATPPPFEVEEALLGTDAAAGTRVVPVNGLAELPRGARQYVVVGAGKTATDAIIWLLSRDVDPDAICWIRPRDPWMLNRAVVQPDPAIFHGMAADVMESAAAASSLRDLFHRLEDAGVMLRIDRDVTPTMAKAPTLATWELEQLRSIQNVIRRGHLEAVTPETLHFADGTVRVPADTVVVHCAADGLRRPRQLPVWRGRHLALQPIRAGFPCFGAALIGYVEATRGSDAEKNRLCPPSSYGNTLADWARMNVDGTRAARSFSADPDIKAWADGVALNPARIPADHPGSPALDEALERLARHTPDALERLAELR